MGQGFTITCQIVTLVAALGALGIGVATFIFVLQDHNARLDAESSSTASPKPGGIIDTPQVIPSDNEKYPQYNSFSQLLSKWADRKVDPCTDFYQFTCGVDHKFDMSFDVSDDENAAALVKILNSAVYFANATKPLKQLKNYYDKCRTNTLSNSDYFARSKRRLDDVLNATGGLFPLFYQNQSINGRLSADALTTLLSYPLSQYSVQTLVQFGIDTDWRDPHHAKGGYSLMVDQPATFYRSTYYGGSMWGEYRQRTIDEIVDHMNRLVKLYGAAPLDQSTLLKEATRITELDYSLATAYSTDQIERRKYARMYNPYTIGEMQTKWPAVQWNAFFTKSLSPVSDILPHNITDSTRIIVNEVDKLSKLSSDISTNALSGQTLTNYIIYSFVRRLTLPTLSAESRRRPHDLEPLVDDSTFVPRPRRRVRRSPPRAPRLVVRAESQDEKDTDCAVNTIDYLAWANTRVFVDQTWPSVVAREEIKKNVGSVVRAILQGFRGQLNLLDWMSESTKRSAYEKIDHLVVNIAFPDWVLDDARLADYYKRLSVSDGDDYLTVVDKLNAFSFYEGFRPWLLKMPADRTDFSSSASETNAWYQPEVNSITFPGGILHAPFYDPAYPAAVNFGAMGVIAGHELTHGFDDEGVQWDGTGVLKSWMDDSSAKSFEKMADCVITEYDQFCPFANSTANQKVCVNGAQTQGENIADNGGMQAAYKAFKAYEAFNGPDPLLPGDNAYLTADQLFFLAFAQVWCQQSPADDRLLRQLLTDPHSPSKYRVFGTIQNFPGFKKAFNCPKNAPYAPDKHCDVWTSEPTKGSPVVNGVPVVSINDVNVLAPEQIKPRDLAKYNAYQKNLVTLSASSNFSVDPCHDFYQYSCGTFPGEKNTFYDMDDANYALIRQQLDDPVYAGTIQGSAALKKLQKLYNACIAELKSPTIASANYILAYIERLKGYLGVDIPLLGGTAVTYEKSELARGLGYLSFTLGIDTFVTVMVDTYWPSPQENSAGYGNQLFIDQLTARYGRPYYEEDAWNHTLNGYKKAATAIVRAYAKMQGFTVATDVDAQIDALIAFERSLVLNFTGTDAERRQYARQWNQVAPADNAALGGLDWPEYWKLAPSAAQNWTTQGRPIVFNEKQKTTDLLKYVLDVSNNQTAVNVVNYLFLRVLFANAELIPCSSGQCLAMKAEATRRDVPVPGKRPRRIVSVPLPPVDADASEDEIRQSCASATSALADAQGRVYIDARWPSAEEKSRVRNGTLGVMSNIRDALKSMLMQLDWMDADSKTRALKKADNIQINPAFPEFLTDNGKLDASYADLVFAENASYYEMTKQITAHNILTTFNTLNLAKANREDFGGQTSVVNAWYEPELNSITFPAGILQDPYFNLDYPAGLNYGGLGVVAGHELTHGFDDEGVQWDFDGRLAYDNQTGTTTWMTTHSQEGFNKMAQCVIDQYGHYCPLDASFNPNCTNGLRTQGENIADNGGIHAAWRAYLSHVELNGPDPLFADRVFGQLTEDQLYFRNFAQVWCMSPKELTTDFMYNRLLTDPHSLGPFRVLGTLSNIPAFKAAFNCRANAVYAPDDHCRVWVPTVIA